MCRCKWLHLSARPPRANTSTDLPDNVGLQAFAFSPMSPPGFSVRSPLAIALVVLLLHALALWALQKRVLPLAADLVSAPERLRARLVPMVVQDQSPSVVASTNKPPSPPPGPASRPVPQKADAKAAQATAPADPNPVPVSAMAPTLVPVTAGVAPVGVVQTASTVQGATSSSPGAGPSAATGVPTTAPGAASARVDPPSSSADYLQNPQPAYPPLSRRRGEQGRVVVNVLIGVDGVAQKADITSSSGFPLLDQAALATVKSWRYVPGKRGGVPQEMWFAVPIQFVIE